MKIAVISDIHGNVWALEKVLANIRAKGISQIINKHTVNIKPVEQLNSELKYVSQNVIISGHSHIPRIVSCENKLIINPGSVGLPAYDDDKPYYYKMETFSPFAKYSIVNIEKAGITVDQISIEYSYEKAAKKVEQNYRPDWAKWLRTGTA